MISDDERREVARRLRELHLGGGSKDLIERTLSDAIGAWRRSGMSWDFITERLADLIEPSYKPDAEYETWYNGLSHFGDERGGPSTIHELIEEIVWAALTVDLGPNGNTDPSTGIDEGRVYTDKLFAEWEREALRLSGGVDRDALLALEGDMFEDATGLALISQLENNEELQDLQSTMAKALMDYARRIREALGVES